MPERRPAAADQVHQPVDEPRIRVRQSGVSRHRIGICPDDDTRPHCLDQSILTQHCPPPAPPAAHRHEFWARWRPGAPAASQGPAAEEGIYEADDYRHGIPRG